MTENHDRKSPKSPSIPADWWLPSYKGGFFGANYVQGDDSKEGYLHERKLTREDRTFREVLAVTEILDYFHPPWKDGVLVDCPCGFGRHTNQFARYCRTTIGVDLNHDYLLSAKDAVTASGAIYVEADMRNLPLHKMSVSAVTNLWTAFGFFDTDEQNVMVLEGWSRIMIQGGIAVIHSDLNPAMVKRGAWVEPSARTLASGGELGVHERFDQPSGRVVGTWRITFPNGHIDEQQYSIRVWSKDEWETFADQTGFDVVGLYASLDKPLSTPLGDESQECIVVLKKR